MNAVVSNIPRGRNFVRSLIARSHGAIGEDAIPYVENRWGSHHGPRILKAATAAHVSADFGNETAAEFFGLIAEKSLLGRIPGLRRVEFNKRMIRMASGLRGFWVAEAKPIPLSRASITGSTLRPRKVSAIVCATKEALEVAGPITEAGLQGDLTRAITDALDAAFIDASNAGIADETPASITYGAPSIAATGNAAEDIAALLAMFTGDLSAAVFVSDPTTAAEIALARDAGGSLPFADAGPRGGSIIGVPLLTSRASPRDSGGGQIILVDASAIAVGFESLAVETAEHASLLMDDDPESADPATAVAVSLWQMDLVAFKSTALANWERQRSGAVAVLVGAGYSTTGAGT